MLYVPSLISKVKIDPDFAADFWREISGIYQDEAPIPVYAEYMLSYISASNRNMQKAFGYPHMRPVQIHGINISV